MKQACLLWILLIASCQAGLKEGEHIADFGVPGRFYEDQDFHPLHYLESYPVNNTSQKLNPKQKKRLGLLFIEAACACKKKYHQDYPLNTSAPLYRLLRTNFPQVASREAEGGHVIFLGDIAKMLEKEVAKDFTKDK